MMECLKKCLPGSAKKCIHNTTGIKLMATKKRGGVSAEAGTQTPAKKRRRSYDPRDCEAFDNWLDCKWNGCKCCPKRK